MHCVAKVLKVAILIEVAVNLRLQGIIYQWLSRFLNRKHNMQSNAEYNMIIVCDNIVAWIAHGATVEGC